MLAAHLLAALPSPFKVPRTLNAGSYVVGPLGSSL
jgi:hypothetical protein